MPLFCARLAYMTTPSMPYREGFRDGMELIESVGLEMASHGNPPAMPEEYRKGFAAAIKVMREYEDEE